MLASIDTDYQRQYGPHSGNFSALISHSVVNSHVSRNMSGSPGGTRLPSHGSFDTRVPPPSRALATPDAPPDAGGPRPAVEFSEATGPTPKRRRSGSLPGESADAEPDSFGRIDLDATDDAGAADSGGDDAGGESAAGPLLTHNLSVKMGAEPEADSELLTPERSSTEARRRVLGVSALVAVTFFNVSGGPVGAESIFAAGGPALGIIGLLVFPWLWAVPVSLIVAELSSSMPTDGGYTVWVTQAFGPYWGFQEGYWSWLSGVVDNALYPVLAVDMIEQLTGVEYHWTVGYAIKLSATVTFTYVNMRGVEIVGRLLEALCVITMLPFLLLCLWGIPQMEWSRLGIFAEPGQWNWGLWLGTLFWNFNGFDGTSTFAGEVRDPTRTYPRAMFLSVVVISLAYLLPLCVAAGVDKPAWSTWDDGSFVAIAQNIGGDWLGYTVIVSSIMGGIGLFTTELFVDSFQVRDDAAL